MNPIRTSIKNVGFGFILALQFLTRIPLPVQCPWNPATAKWALRCYPLVGLLIGGFFVGLGVCLAPHLPVWLLTLFVLTLWVGITGGLHVDAWMDVADAVGSNASPKKKWEIMKDPHVGGFGILALIFLMLWKGACLYLLLDWSAERRLTLFILLGLLSIPALARWLAVFLLNRMPVLKQTGLAWEWKRHVSAADVWGSLLPLLVIFFIFPTLIMLFGAYLVFYIVYAHWMNRHFRGINGDIVGAAIEGGELWGLGIFSIYMWFVMV